MIGISRRVNDLRSRATKGMFGMIVVSKSAAMNVQAIVANSILHIYLGTMNDMNITYLLQFADR